MSDLERLLDRLQYVNRPSDLRAIAAEATRLADLIASYQQPAPVVELDTPGGGWSYRQDYTRCRKPGCKACQGKGHGPYWYGHRTVRGKHESKYFGKTDPRPPLDEAAELEKARATLPAPHTNEYGDLLDEHGNVRLDPWGNPLRPLSKLAENFFRVQD